MARYTIEQISNPAAHGLQMCSHCNGYGSSLKDPIGVDTCTQCGGSGLIPIPKESGDRDNNPELSIRREFV
jgi:DnaJ-class molecular chaperone